MKEQYNQANDEIHAPEDLKEHTIIKMKQEARKYQIMNLVKITASAACLGAVLIGGVYAAGRDRIYVQQVDLSSLYIEMNLGKTVEQQSTKDSRFHLEESKDKDLIPEEILKIKASHIDGMEVSIGKSEDGSRLYAAYEKDGTYYYLTGDGVTQEAFIEYLKEYL